MTEFNDKQIEILQAAEKRFAEEGFDGASVREIAKEAQVNVAMISYYFGSKEKLLEALIIYRIAGMRMELENLLQENISPMEKMMKLTELYIARINKNKCMYQILHFELSIKKRTIDIKAYTEVKKKNIDFLTRVIEEGQQQGIFRNDINTLLIPPTIIGTFFHFQMNRPFYEEILGLTTDEEYENYINTGLTNHIKQIIKAYLVHEN
jgi:AcrR family transcriptional regulator